MNELFSLHSFSAQKQFLRNFSGSTNLEQNRKLDKGGFSWAEVVTEEEKKPLVREVMSSNPSKSSTNS